LASLVSAVLVTRTWASWSKVTEAPLLGRVSSTLPVVGSVVTVPSVRKVLPPSML